MLTFIGASGIAAAAAVTAFRRKEKNHRGRLDNLQANIHVNGIRGKSTVTRMIGGAVRAAGLNAITKTTGTYACVIDSEAGEHPIERTGPANIAEQYSFTRQWVTKDTDVLVAECMAVKPRYQEICQDVILKAGIVVLTNVRLDHQEDMGGTLEEIAASLCVTVPKNGVLVTGERDPKIVEIIRQHCEARNARLVVAEETALSRELTPQFSYQQFEENVAVAIAVCDELGIDRTVAARGMLAARPDPGTTATIELREPGRDGLWWVPMFAVNDWESTVRVFEAVSQDALPKDCQRVVALNNRSDRTDRAAMFVDLVSDQLRDDIDRIVLYGDLQDIIRQRLMDRGFSEDDVVCSAHCCPEHTGEELVDCARKGLEGRDVAVFGMVNIHTEDITLMNRYIDHLQDSREVVAAA